MRVTKCIGFDVTENHRVGGGGTYAAGVWLNLCPRKNIPSYRQRYDVVYPLREQGMDREACIRTIQAAGLPVPPKSACFFCGAAKSAEVADLAETDPDLYVLAIAMELTYRAGRHFKGDSQWTVVAKHKTTGESESRTYQAAGAADARGQFRAAMGDNGQAKQWTLAASQSVTGLGSRSQWVELPVTLPGPQADVLKQFALSLRQRTRQTRLPIAQLSLF